jgi:hypothetical protein
VGNGLHGTAHLAHNRPNMLVLNRQLAVDELLNEFSGTCGLDGKNLMLLRVGDFGPRHITDLDEFVTANHSLHRDLSNASTVVFDGTQSAGTVVLLKFLPPVAGIATFGVKLVQRAQRTGTSCPSFRTMQLISHRTMRSRETPSALSLPRTNFLYFNPLGYPGKLCSPNLTVSLRPCDTVGLDASLNE